MGEKIRQKRGEDMRGRERRREDTGGG